MSIVIAFTGGQGSGKTTLARAVSDHLAPRATLLEGISRTVASRGLPLGEAASLETILDFAREHLLRERLAPQTGVVVLDRCLLDLSAYATVLGFPPVIVGLLDELTLVSLRQMRAVFYVPIAGENTETR